MRNIINEKLKIEIITKKKLKGLDNMCGFVGFISKDRRTSPPHDEIKEVSKKLSHRGPDDYGFYGDEYVSLGFNRLNIIDLEKGNQPLSINNERFWIVFNGEIYNYLGLGEYLRDLPLKTNSDIEVLLALYSKMGTDMISKLRGIFSFLIWDNKENKLFGARDYFGIKPLYYLETSNGIFFSSEKKALLSFYDFDVLLDENSVHHYLTFQYPPEPNTFYKFIKKIPSGHYFSCNLNDDSSRYCSTSPFTLNKYFSPRFKPKKSYINKKSELYQSIKETLIESVKIHLRSDVPVGAFLSSGIDSTSVVALAKKFHPNIKTFTSGFEREEYNEGDIAGETAEKLGVENHTRLVTAEEIMQDLPEIIWYMDDPVADPASIPLYYVSQEASKEIKVVLSGEGVDEFFGGYNIYREPNDLRIFNYLPTPVNKSLFYLSKILPEGIKGKDFIRRGTQTLKERYYGNARIFKEEEKSKFYRKYSDKISYADVTSPYYQEIKNDNISPIEAMQYIDLKTWLPGDILVKADRMTMANSLELRVPFLDPVVFEIARKIPPQLKITKSTTKYAFRKAVEDEIPSSILYRKKLGFPVPTRDWLKDTMYDWARQIIKESNVDYLFNKNEILKLLEAHRKGSWDHSRKIWTILTFILWHENFIENKPQKPSRNITLV